MNHATIVVIDDDPDVFPAVRAALTGHYELECRSDSLEALRAIQQRPPSLVIVDWMMPGLCGDELCAAMRADGRTSGVPIIMLTSRSSTADLAAGLASGADDYVRKPFQPDELRARVNALLRRSSSECSRRLCIGALELDLDGPSVHIAGDEVHLTPTELNMLGRLATTPGKVFTRGDLLSSLQEDNRDVFDRTVDTHIAAMRRKFGTHRTMIETVHGLGYRFRADPPEPTGTTG